MQGITNEQGNTIQIFQKVIENGLIYFNRAVSELFIIIRGTLDIINIINFPVASHGQWLITHTVNIADHMTYCVGNFPCSWVAQDGSHVQWRLWQ